MCWTKVKQQKTPFFIANLVSFQRAGFFAFPEKEDALDASKEAADVSWYPEKICKLVADKLNGLNPAECTKSELESGTHGEAAVKNFVATLMNPSALRSEKAVDGLSPEEQVCPHVNLRPWAVVTTSILTRDIQSS
jgi:hypothetical protein